MPLRLPGPARAGRTGGACPPGAMLIVDSPPPPGPGPGRSLPCCSCRVLSLPISHRLGAPPGPGPQGGDQRGHAALVNAVGLAEVTPQVTLLERDAHGDVAGGG